MVPRVARKGNSFHGAGLYYLHDKKAKTSNRVSFTHTENLPTENPDIAIKMMAYTRMHHAEIKAAAGRAKTGRKVEGPVYTYSLAWHPEQSPTKEHMIEAAKASLEYLGFKDHEALFVAHNDEPQPHIHVILCRINPLTGLVQNPLYDFGKFQKWALAYQRERGEKYCPQREINAEKRKRGERAKDTRSLKAAEFTRWRRRRVKEMAEARKAETANLSAAHAEGRRTLYDEKERRIERHRQEVREQFKPLWAALYRQHRQQTGELVQAQRNAFSRLRYWMHTRDVDRWGGTQLDRRGILRGALEAVLGRQDFAASLMRLQQADKEALASRVAAATLEAIEIENQRHREELEILELEQREESRSLKEIHSAQSQAAATAIKEDSDFEEFTAEQLKEEFERRVREAAEEQEERDERERKLDKGRERD